MKQALTFTALMFLAACPKGGASMSTETGGTSGGGGGGEGGEASASDRNTGDTSGMSLEERKYWKDQEDYLFRSIDSASERCGVKFSMEWAGGVEGRRTFRTSTEKHNNAPYSVCANMVDRVDMLCREGDDEKASVAAKIKGFRCGYANPRNATMDNGIVVWMGNHEESNPDDYLRPWLLKNL